MNRSSFKPEFLMPADLFTLMKSLRRGLVVGSKQIVNRVSEDDATGGHSFDNCTFCPTTVSIIKTLPSIPFVLAWIILNTSYENELLML
ncbi:hypothetical protein GCK72_002952 [Caenorhabditis remanei]|uniref:Uncharacterized protein n=1 Tax=Caenorhabditis remanei TaxID=31234 RepID=A0A6A5HXC5_CAERE|nr:hypothetical protein GCK72_002952 [Caenorhabditis remanei]KAF1771127.1 hypothetical protein GCK72_002952 [Caenorhabditis remanei]